MKKYLFAASMLAAMTSAPAFADGNNQSTDIETFTLTAVNPAKCNLEASSYTLTIAGNSLSNDDGFAKGTVGTDVANALNAAGVNAWCTGASNKLQSYRTAFVTGGGVKGTDLFNRAVLYNLELDIVDAVRTPGGYKPIEGTDDGQGNGPGLGVGAGIVVSRFGPSGLGSPVKFTSFGTSTAVTNGNSTGATGSFTADSNRLIAGTYTSTYTIELTPGV